LIGVSGPADPAAFEAAVTKVGEKLQAAVQLDPVAAISSYPVAVKAFNTAPSCRALAATRTGAPPTS
jgi:hypothetical protein